MKEKKTLRCFVEITASQIKIARNKSKILKQRTIVVFAWPFYITH